MTNAHLQELLSPFRAMGIPTAVFVDFDILRVRDEFKHVYEGVGGSWSTIKNDYDDLIREIEGLDDVDTRLHSAVTLLNRVSNELASQGDSATQLKWLVKRLRDVREKASVWSELKALGKSGLSARAAVLFDEMVRNCNGLGLFIVITGERESWLTPEVPYTRNKKKWTDSALRFVAANKLANGHSLYMFVSSVRAFCMKNPDPNTTPNK